jgi:hypothetical protein
MAGYPPLSHASLQFPDPHHARTLTPQLHCQIHDHQEPCHPSAPDPSLDLVPHLARIPVPLAHHHSGPAELQLCVEQPDPALWTSLAHQALLDSSSMWNNWSPTPMGQAQAWHETATSTSLPGTPSLGWCWPQLYRLHQAPAWAATRGWTGHWRTKNN